MIACRFMGSKDRRIHTEPGVYGLKLERRRCGGVTAVEDEMQRVLPGAETLIRYGQGCLAAWAGQYLGRFALNHHMA